MSAPLLVVAALLILVLLVLLIVAQVWMSRHFRRTLNLFLAVATFVVIVLGIWFTVAAVTQGSDADAATANGSGPVVIFTQARIGALQMRADDELTLLTRDSVGSYQPDFDMTAGRISRLLGSASNSAGLVEEGRITSAQDAFVAYERVHRQIRNDDGAGNFKEAVDLASGNGPNQLPVLSSNLDGILADAIASRTADLRPGDVGRIRRHCCAHLGQRHPFDRHRRLRPPGLPTSYRRVPVGVVRVLPSHTRRYLSGLVLAALVAVALGAGACSTTPSVRQTSVNSPTVLPADASVVHPMATPAPPSNCTASYPPPSPMPTPGHMPASSWMAHIYARGYLIAGVDQNTYLWAYRDPVTGQLQGFDIDMLEQINQAIFGANAPPHPLHRSWPTTIGVRPWQTGQGGHGGRDHDDQLRTPDARARIRIPSTSPPSTTWRPSRSWYPSVRPLPVRPTWAASGSARPAGRLARQPGGSGPEPSTWWPGM